VPDRPRASRLERRVARFLRLLDSRGTTGKGAEHMATSPDPTLEPATDVGGDPTHPPLGGIRTRALGRCGLRGGRVAVA
jgi:hypothetical protein